MERKYRLKAGETREKCAKYFQRCQETGQVPTAPGLALALGWNWLYIRQVQAPMEALAETETAAVMTAQDYPETVKSGVISSDDIDLSVARILIMKNRYLSDDAS